MSKKLFDTIDRDIIRTLYTFAIPMTLGEISEQTGISWITVKGHMKRLVDMGVVIEIKTETRKTPKLVWNFNDFGNLAVASA